MKIVSVLAANEEPDVVEAHLAFHLSAGVDFVLAAAPDASTATAEILDSYARKDRLELVSAQDTQDPSWRTTLARRAVLEHAADWVFSTDADEFWWPRGENLADVLAVIPERYEVVQALVREFRPRPTDGGAESASFAERLTIRSSLKGSGEESRELLEWALRPVDRASPDLVLESERESTNGRRVPLRAWYPIEVFRFPFRSLEQVERRYSGATVPAPRSKAEAAMLDAARNGRLAEAYSGLVVDDERFRAELDVGSLAEDLRLRDALRTLTEAPPAGGLVLRPPDIVDDAAYAVECAAVGEVDLARLDAHLRELEDRIGVLEARFWPRVARTLSRVVRR